MLDEKKNYWFALSKHVFVSFNNPDTILLYHTINGTYLINSKPECIELIKDVYNPINLGVIALESKDDNKCINDFIDEINIHGMGVVIEKTDNLSKPINLLPLLNLQNDIAKLQKNGETHLIGENISEYLTSLNIFINGECKQTCHHCGLYYQQTLSCTKFPGSKKISLKTIRSILSHSASTQVHHINILGGNIFLYPHFNELITLLQTYSYNYHLWINYKNIVNIEDLLDLPFHKEFVISFPLDSEKSSKLILSCIERTDVSLNFLVECQSHLEAVNELINHIKKINYKLIPIYSGSNISFFEKNVYLTKEDITVEPIEMRNIFRNQKLNANFFGSLNFLPDGTVKANTNEPSIGRFPEKSLLELIYEELITNTAWRKTRDGTACDKCVFKYLCPPPSNIELALGKYNLCHVHCY
jgi:pseudo-rSAM protein